MLLRLVSSRQLKKKPKGANADTGDTHVLVMEDGKVLWPMLADEMKTNVFTGPAATFVIPETMTVVDVNFETLEAAITKKKIGGVGRVFEVLRSAQSLTIQLVAKALGLEREDAKVLVDLLVANGAYTKYYSYWRRTPMFSEWLMNRKEK